MAIKSFADLTVWQRAMDLAVEVYGLTDNFPKREMFVLSYQIRKACVSIPSNIAEGFCRGYTAVYINHLNVALGSEGELFTQLELARRLGFANGAALDNCLDRLSEVGKMLHGLIGAVERSTSGR